MNSIFNQKAAWAKHKYVFEVSLEYITSLKHELIEIENEQITSYYNNHYFKPKKFVCTKCDIEVDYDGIQSYRARSNIETLDCDLIVMSKALE